MDFVSSSPLFSTILLFFKIFIIIRFSSFDNQSKNCGHRIHVLFMMYDVYWYCQMKKNDWLWKCWKKGSREKGARGNEIHAPCACVDRDSSAVRRFFFRLAGAVGLLRAMHTKNSGFAASTLGRHISPFRGYRILFSIRNSYINRFTNHFSIHS